MPGYLRSIVFAIILCLVCSLLLTAASTGLRPYQQRNIAADRQRNILTAFNIVDETQDLGTEEIVRLYDQNIHRAWVDGDGRLIDETRQTPGDLPLYLYIQDGTIRAYGVPIQSRGLWGQINAYLAIEDDGSTVRGFTVFQHAETPGLGGEIETRWFRKQFEGKKLIDQQGQFVSVRIAKGNVEEGIPPEKRPNYVDGISGATLTGQFLSTGIADVLQNYEPLSAAFRRNGAGEWKGQ
jgi:Na+-transporting NADH:ubiquinone oxidoreductase subunit C